MAGMFAQAHCFNQKLEAWDTSQVTDTRCMFYGACSFNQPLLGWNLSKVKKMGGMFAYARLFNQSLREWDCRQVGHGYRGIVIGADSFQESRLPRGWSWFQAKGGVKPEDTPQCLRR